MEKKFVDIEERVRDLTIGGTKGSQFAGLMELEALNKRLSMIESQY